MSNALNSALGELSRAGAKGLPSTTTVTTAKNGTSWNGTKSNDDPWSLIKNNDDSFNCMC